MLMIGSALGQRTNYGTGAGPYGVAIGDLNGDAKPDLVTPNHDSDTVSALMNIGSGSSGVSPEPPHAGTREALRLQENAGELVDLGDVGRGRLVAGSDGVAEQLVGRASLEETHRSLGR